MAAVIVTALGHFSLRERLLLGWAGLRGATPIVFATFPVTEDLPHGHLIFNVAFFVVLFSTMLQGTTIEPLARLLGVTSDEAALPAPLVEPVLLNRLGAEVVQFPVRESDAVVGHPVRELGLPREALLNVIVRGERAIPPRGSTVIESGDQLHMIVRQEVAVEFQDVMRTWRTGPLGGAQARRARACSAARRSPVCGHGRTPTATRHGPAQVAGLEVVDQLRTRRDEPGALVALDDGRFARHRPAARHRAGRRAPGRRATAPRPRGRPGRARVVAGSRRRAGPLNLKGLTPLCELEQADAADEHHPGVADALDQRPGGGVDVAVQQPARPVLVHPCPQRVEPDVRGVGRVVVDAGGGQWQTRTSAAGSLRTSLRGLLLRVGRPDALAPARIGHAALEAGRTTARRRGRAGAGARRRWRTRSM